MPLIYANPSRSKRREKASKGSGVRSGAAASSTGTTNRRRNSMARKRRARRASTRTIRRRKRRTAAIARAHIRKRRAAKSPVRRRRKRRAAAQSNPPARRKRRAAAPRKRATRKRRASAAPKRRRARRTTPAPRKRPRRSSRQIWKGTKGPKHLSASERNVLAKLQEGVRVHMRRSRERASFKKRWERGEVMGPVPNPRRSTQASLLRARRAIRNRKRTPLASATIRRYRMRSNPGGVMELIGAVLPVAGSLYATRVIANKLAPMIPGLNSLPAQFQGPVVAVGMLGIGYVATKKIAALKKHGAGILIGAGINLFDSIIKSFAPTEVRAAFGLGGIYDSALGEYNQVGDYLQVGATPIDDDITLSDYVAVGDDLQQELGLEEELGLSQELGLEQELGNDSLSRAYLGGVARGSMLAPVQQQQLLAPIPARSFTKEVGRAGAGYDNQNTLYTGIFAGGY